jgi:hypothetical protein
MSVKIEIHCDKQHICKFASTCLLCKSMEDGGYFGPKLQIQIANKELQVRCYSFTVKGGNYDTN